MSLRFGYAETGWARPPVARLREAQASVVRVLLPDPSPAWEPLAEYLDGVLEAGAAPMITISGFYRPFDDPGAASAFAGRCGELVQACLDRWGGEAVRSWYWSIGNEPNSEWTHGGLTFELYQRIYEETAGVIRGRLAPWLNGSRPRIGGPAVDGFQPFWLDWVWRLANQIDNSLVGFVCWHRFGEWRDYGEWGAPPDPAVFEGLLMGRAADYQTRARAVSRLLRGRGILNVCGQWNAHSHHESRVSGRFNHSLFGAAYSASGLLHLIRGGADLEIAATRTAETGPYGALDPDRPASPSFLARALLARFVRPGDRVRFPHSPRGLQVALVCGDGGRQSAVLVHLRDETAAFPLEEFSPRSGVTLLKIDGSGGGEISESPFDGRVAFQGYGVVVVGSGA